MGTWGRLATLRRFHLHDQGVPANPRACIRCGQSYQPASGPQKYCVLCQPIVRQVYSIEWGRRNPERRRMIDQRARERNPEYYRLMRKFVFHRGVEALKESVLGHYSNQRFRCACCGETERDLLVIDHKDGHGNEHRKQIFGRPQAGYRFYDWLVKHGYPLGFQVLCCNCNVSKSKHGACVHVAKPTEVVPQAGMKTITRRSGNQRIMGYEASLVKWRPRS